MSSLLEIEFELYYFLLLPLVFLVCEKVCRHRPATLLFPHTAVMQQASHAGNRLISAVKWLAIISLSLAMASPVLLDKKILKDRVGYDIVMAFDASGSMEYPFRRGQRISKFDITKKMVTGFVAKRKNDNLAAVAFGKYAFVISPLTYDKKVLETMVEQITITPAFSRGTAIGDAIAQSVRILKESEAKNRVIVLTTDGEEEGEVVIPYDKATAMAKKYGIKIYTIGIGQDGQFNSRGLKYIADETGGAFFSADNPDALSRVYEKIDTLEKSKITASDFVKKEYLYTYPLFVAILATLIYLYLRYRERH